MLRKTALNEVPVGTTFEVWNRKYTVLDKGRDKIFVLAAEIETTMQFREDGEVYAVAPNDFRDSTIRNWLNDDYLGALLRDGPKNGDILDLEIDLKCTLGQHEYGKDKAKVGLLTLEEYGEYYDVIPRIDSSWWLATPWKTPSRSPSTLSTNSVWYVYSNGGCGFWDCNSTFGVPPALNLSPSLLVAWEDGNCEEDSGDWDEYIKYLHKWAVEHDHQECKGSCPMSYDEWMKRLNFLRNAKECASRSAESAKGGRDKQMELRSTMQRFHQNLSRKSRRNRRAVGEGTSTQDPAERVSEDVPESKS